MQEVVAAANEAIHGSDVSDETAASVVRAGSDLLESLRLASVRPEPLLRFSTLADLKNWLAQAEPSEEITESLINILRKILDDFQKEPGHTSISNIVVRSRPGGGDVMINYHEQ